MKNNQNLTEFEVKKISERYVCSVDKWNRMYAGIASNLTRYEDDIIHIKVENTEKVKPSSFETAENIVKTWVGFNSELRKAKSWVDRYPKIRTLFGK